MIKEDYLQHIVDAGFKNIQIQKERKIELPDSMLEKYLDSEGVEKFKNEFAGIASITVYADKACCSNQAPCC